MSFSRELKQHIKQHVAVEERDRTRDIHMTECDKLVKMTE